MNMMTYPELSQSDNKLAFSLLHPSKSSQNPFQVYEPKRKPIKKVIVKKYTPPVAALPPLPPQPTPAPENFKICPCCNAKVVIKHRCEHSLCEKPCSKIRKRPGAQPKESAAINSVSEALEEEEFTPYEQVEGEESKFSHS